MKAKDQHQCLCRGSDILDLFQCVSICPEILCWFCDYGVGCLTQWAQIVDYAPLQFPPLELPGPYSLCCTWQCLVMWPIPGAFLVVISPLWWPSECGALKGQSLMKGALCRLRFKGEELRVGLTISGNLTVCRMRSTIMFVMCVEKYCISPPRTTNCILSISFCVQDKETCS